MSGFLAPIWEAVFRSATWAALIFGALSIGSAFVSAWVGWEITDATQKDADKKIKAADERIAEFNTRAKEAELELAQIRQRMAPRNIKGEQFLKALEGKPKAPVEILFVRDDGEAFSLSLQIRDWLRQASWLVEEPRPITPDDVSSRLVQNHPLAMAAGGQPQGVSLFLRAESQADFDRENDDPFDSHAPVNTPRKALSRALLGSLGTISGGMSDENGRPGVLRVIVGPKPQFN